MRLNIRRKQYKFQVELTVNELSNVTADGSLNVTTKLLDGGKLQDASESARMVDGIVKWNHQVSFVCTMKENSDTGILDTCECRLSVKQDDDEQIGFVVINLAKYAGAGSKTEIICLHSDNQDNDSSSAEISFTVNISLCPELTFQRQLTQKQAKSNPHDPYISITDANDNTETLQQVSVPYSMAANDVYLQPTSDEDVGEDDATEASELEQLVQVVDGESCTQFMVPTDEKNACVLVMGTTGTGKSTTINIYTGSNLPTGTDSQAMTGDINIVEDQTHTGKSRWIDNPGWSDTEGKSDNMLFKDMLRFLQDNKLYHIKAVIWNVLPQIRMDSGLQAQARLIDMFTVGKAKGTIWSNVVIIAKGTSPGNEGKDCQGAETAARAQSIHAKPVSLKYELVTDDYVTDHLTGVPVDIRKEKLNMLTADEIRLELETTLASLPPCVQVVFANKKCEACAQTGDPRLMEDVCHKEKELGHPGYLQKRFSKKQVALALGGGMAGVAAITAGVLGAGAAASLVAVGILPMAPGVGMAGVRHLGYDMRYSCCGKPKIDEDNQQVACGCLAKLQEEGIEGCTDMCTGCASVWGNEPVAHAKPACVLIKHPDENLAKSMKDYEVFVKEHSLVDIKTVETTEL